MIKFRIYDDLKYKYFEVKGHADGEFVNAGGFNAVCGMVSVLAQSAMYGCRKYARKTTIIKNEPGWLKFSIHKYDSVGVAIMDTAMIGIKAVKEQFPSCFKDGD